MAITWLDVIYSVRGGGGDGGVETTTGSRPRCYCLPPSVVGGWRPAGGAASCDRPTDRSDCRTTAAAIRGRKRKEERRKERIQRVCDDQTRWQTQTTTTTTRVPCRAVPCPSYEKDESSACFFFFARPFPILCHRLFCRSRRDLGYCFFASVCLCGWWW